MPARAGAGVRQAGCPLGRPGLWRAVRGGPWTPGRKVAALVSEGRLPWKYSSGTSAHHQDGDVPPSLGIVYRDRTPGRPPRSLRRDRDWHLDHSLVTAVISIETEAGHQGEPSPHLGGMGRVAVVASPRDGSPSSQVQGSGRPSADTVRGRVLRLCAGHAPVAGLLDGLVVAPG